MGALIQGGVDLPVLAHYTLSGEGVTGLTVTIDVHRLRSGTWSEIVTAGAMTEVGDGVYSYTVGSASVAAGDVLVYVCKTAGSVDQAHLAGMTRVEASYTATVAGRVDAAISTRATPADVPSAAAVAAQVAADLDAAHGAGSWQTAAAGPSAAAIADAVWDEALSGHGSAGSAGAALSSADAPTTDEVAAAVATVLRRAELIVRTPVLQASLIEIVRGDDYSASDGRALEWDLTDAAGLTGATVVFGVEVDGTDVTLGTGSVLTPGEATQTLRVELTAAETTDLDESPAQGWPYTVTAVRDGRRLSYLTGRARVRDNHTGG